MRLTILAAFATAMACCGPAVTSARDDAPARRGEYSFELVDEAGRVLPTYAQRGRTYVLGSVGQRYLVRVRNDSPKRVEVVVSVDGRDVLDGGPAEWRKRGYLVEAHSTATIDGFRLSQDAVAAFRFGPVRRSYAALQGDVRDVGVVGVAVFTEREVLRAPPPVETPLRSERAAPPSAEPSGAARDAAPSPSAKNAEALAQRRPGLGTEFGEEHASHVRQVPFERASARPDVVLTARYDDRAGLVAAGVIADPRCDEQDLRRNADPFRRDSGYAPPPRGWSRAHPVRQVSCSDARTDSTASIQPRWASASSGDVDSSPASACADAP